jgi:hypothetical protein
MERGRLSRKRATERPPKGLGAIPALFFGERAWDRLATALARPYAAAGRHSRLPALSLSSRHVPVRALALRTNAGLLALLPGHPFVLTALAAVARQHHLGHGGSMYLAVRPVNYHLKGA